MEKQFEIINIELSDFVQSCIGEKEGKVVCHMYLDEYKHTEKTRLHAEVMNDSLNVHFETGFNASELLRQNREMKEALTETESALKWYMENTTPYNNDMQTFHDL